MSADYWDTVKPLLNHRAYSHVGISVSRVEYGMVVEGLPVDRLRDYLNGLKPEARALLIAEIERSALNGTEVPGAELILEALRPTIRQSPEPIARVGSPVRHFFRPLEPFLVNSNAPRVLVGRIDRSSLLPIWEWIGRDLLPPAAKTYAREATTALLNGDIKKADRLAHGFQDAVAAAIWRNIDPARNEDRNRRRFAAQLPLPRALEDLQVLHRVLVNREFLDRLATRVPANVSNLADEQLDNIVGLLRQPSAEGLQPALILILGRLGAWWQLIRLAVRSAESDVASRVAAAPLAPAVTLVFAEIRQRVDELRLNLLHGQMGQATATCRELHSAIRALRTEINLAGDNAWSRELAALRGSVSDLLRPELEGMEGRVRRLLRPRPARDIKAGSTLDACDIAETEARIELVAACRNFASELAINQIAPKVYHDILHYFDTGAPALLESLRSAGEADRPFRQSQMDAAIRFAGKLFGAEYASLLSKATVLAGTPRETAKAG